jgi:hypothetical protein
VGAAAIIGLNPAKRWVIFAKQNARRSAPIKKLVAFPCLRRAQAIAVSGIFVADGMKLHKRSDTRIVRKAPPIGANCN